MQSMWREDLRKGMTPLQFLLFSLRPHRGTLILASLCTIVAYTLEVSVSYVFKMIVDAAAAFAQGGTITPLWYAGYLYIGILCAHTLFRRTSNHFASFWATGARATARYALSSYVLNHSTLFFSNRFAGAISSKIGSAAQNVRTVGIQISHNFLGLLVAVITAIVLAFLTHPMLGYILLFWIACVFPLNIYLSQQRRPLSAVAEKAEATLVGATVDMLTNISTIQEHSNDAFELSRIQALIVDRKEKALRNWHYGNFMISLNTIVQIGFTGLLLLGSFYLAERSIVSAGDIALVISLVVIIQANFTRVGEVLGEFAEAWATLEEGIEDILTEQEMSDSEGATSLTSQSSSITFERASFTYGNEPVFDKLSLSIKDGQKVGLVGRSGAGKSTLVKLLLRHYDVTSGEIRIGDENIASVTKDSLRRAIAVVPQEPLLFHRSIRDNIAYGKPDASEEEIIRAAKLAEAHDFIEKVPGGYEALVGERGVKLSGGQRQRIVIARAILKNAPILVLDEATSALDSESEAAVQKALFALMEHRTVIAIAHRLSTLRVMDRIIVMEEGRIVEDGTHEELLAKNGIYATLWNHQAGGFIEE